MVTAKGRPFDNFSANSAIWQSHGDASLKDARTLNIALPTPQYWLVSFSVEEPINLSGVDNVKAQKCCTDSARESTKVVFLKSPSSIIPQTVS